MTRPSRSEDIAALYRTFEAAVAAKDVAGLLDKFYVPEVAFVGTGLPLTQGSVVKDVLAGLCGAAKSVRVEQLQTLVVEPGKVVVDFAIVHVTTMDGASLKDRSTCIFRNGSAGWRCVADVFVRD